MNPKSTLRKYLSRSFPHALEAFRVARRTWELRRQLPAYRSEGFRFVTATSVFDVEGYETEERAFVRRQLAETDVFVDVGANVGLYTCMALSLGKHVVAIEPLQWNLSYLYLNLQANGWNDLELYPVAVGSQPRLVEFQGSGMSASMVKGWAPDFNAVDSAIPERQVTPVATLDILLGRRFAGKRVFVKVDVEGAEYHVLQGAQLLLSLEPRPVWMVEVFSTQHHPQGFNPRFLDVFERFWEHGYAASAINGAPISPAHVEGWVRERTPAPASNFVFRKLCDA